MPLSENEKKKIDEIENAVGKKKPVGKLKSDRKDSGFEKLDGGNHRMMGDMIPPLKRRPGLADLIRDAADDLLGRVSPPMMGIIIPLPRRGRWKPESDETDRSSGNHGAESPEKDKHDKSEGRSRKKSK